MQGFEVLGKLGEGTYSSVFKVRRKADQQIYALKQVKLQALNDKERSNALNEVRLLASVKHPNVVAYKEAFFDQAGNALCLVMELADAGDLYERILEYQKRGRYMSEGFIWHLAGQVARGLQACHELMVLHRDLKSANVFLWRDGQVKLGDFNVAKVAKEGLLRTQTGTPYYASPEVWRDQPYSLKSDIWSLGCVLYEACALHPPFRAEDMQKLCGKVIKGEFARLPRSFSGDLNTLVTLLLTTDPSARPSCTDILNYPPLVRRLKPVISQSLTDATSPLLRTIVFPKNTHLLAARLPASAYREDRRSATTEPDEDPPFSLPRLAEPGRSRQGLTPDSHMLQCRPARDLSDPGHTPVRLHKQVLRESYGGLQVVKVRGNSLSRPNRAHVASVSMDIQVPSYRKSPNLYIRSPDLRKHRGLKRISEDASHVKGPALSLSPIR